MGNCYFGLLFLVAAYTSIGIFTSSISNNQIVSFIASVFLCLLFYIGFEGVAEFMYAHSDEERMHMLKLVKFVNERGGHANISDLSAPPTEFGSFKDMFQTLFDHEVFVSKSINDLVHITLEERDYATHNFLQWYVSEQIEEEALARNILDKINLIGDDKGGLYLFDNDVKQIVVAQGAADAGA